MSLSKIIKDEAIKQRKEGLSLSETAQSLHISTSTASLWLRSVPLSQTAQKRLQNRRNIGKARAKETQHKKLQASYVQAQTNADRTLENIKFTPEIKRLLLSFLLWTEGGKSAERYVSFINSDPLMISTFLTLLHQSFSIDEKKIRALIHMHEYHNEKTTKQFWMNITGLPKEQFSKTYQKPHTGDRIRVGYQGSIRIRYYNAFIARELRALYNSCARQLGT